MKKICYLVMCVFLTLCIGEQASAASFRDVPEDHFAYDAITWAERYDIINGYADGTFRPSDTITEQQFAKLLANFYELESPEDELIKHTTIANWSDDYYNRLASYGVPLNGYFDYGIRATAVKRGVVAQAIAHLANGKSGLDASIQFLLDYYISTGQNPQYENRHLQKFFGATNNLTRAQVILMLHRMHERNFYAISEDAQSTHDSLESLLIRAKHAQLQLDASLHLTTPTKSAWEGVYAYYYKWGQSLDDINRREAVIANVTTKGFTVAMTANDGAADGHVEGTATMTSKTKAILTQTSNGQRCVIELEQLPQALKITEVDCRSFRDEGVTFSGTLKKQ
ncbi:S-layer homology domain-containing protein [Lysinibacillus piscis]|nr:S-layer homology domain-containing protein [Lysinibacillus sp. KH24]